MDRRNRTLGVVKRSVLLAVGKATGPNSTEGKNRGPQVDIELIVRARPTSGTVGFLPITSPREYPVNRSNAGLQYWMFPSASVIRISSAVCSTAAARLARSASARLRSADPSIFSRSVAALLSQNARQVARV